jgi:hypothetical protein
MVFRADIFPVLWQFLLPERKRQFQVFSELRSLWRQNEKLGN